MNLISRAKRLLGVTVNLMRRSNPYLGAGMAWLTTPVTADFTFLADDTALTLKTDDALLQLKADDTLITVKQLDNFGGDKDG